jgi:hypothetical protein
MKMNVMEMKATEMRAMKMEYEHCFVIERAITHRKATIIPEAHAQNNFLIRTGERPNYLQDTSWAESHLLPNNMSDTVLFCTAPHGYRRVWQGTRRSRAYIVASSLVHCRFSPNKAPREKTGFQTPENLCTFLKVLAGRRDDINSSVSGTGSPVMGYTLLVLQGKFWVFQ